MRRTPAPCRPGRPVAPASRGPRGGTRSARPRGLPELVSRRGRQKEDGRGGAPRDGGTGGGEADGGLAPFGLTEATWLPLVRVARAPAPMRQKHLAASLVLDGSTVVRLLDALEASGLIERREESADRRAK